VQNVANWPWHPSHAALETLALLGAAPRFKMSAVDALLRNSSAWVPFMEEWVQNTTNVWGGSQQAQSLPGIARSADPSASSPFFDFYFGWLANHSDAATGYWVPRCARRGDAPPLQEGDGAPQPHKRCSAADPINQLGGAFHLYHVHECFGKAWPHPTSVVDATLASQDPASGMWRTGEQYPVSLWSGIPSNCIDLDGVHSMARSSRLAGGYRWADVEQACKLYLASAHAQLTNETMVLGRSAAWAQESHLLHGALSAVAECATWFPHLVRTVRPWRRVRATDAAATRSCAYA
jgi:hypothetical protein